MVDCSVSWGGEGGGVRYLVGALRQSTTKDYIRAEGDFHKDIVERTNKAEIRPDEQSERRVCRRIYVMKYS